MLLLLLGTATAWADKYYMPKSYRSETTPRLTLEQAVGKRFLIYNTAIGTETDEADNTIYGVDKTGFLRNDGAEFAHDKSKERDLFIYNESFVYTLEKHTDDTGTWYAIKSLCTGTYVDCNGKTTHRNAADAKLNIYNWAAAKKLGVADWGVDMECWQYDIVANKNIEHQNVVFVIGRYAQNGGIYWNGEKDSFVTHEWFGHPYVFYEAIELTNEDELPITIEKDFLQELHAYSRCDMYSAQRVYGLVHVHDHEDNQHIKLITEPGRTEAAHGIHLCDGDFLTSLDVNAGESLQFYLGYNLDSEGNEVNKTTSAVHIHLQRNADKTNVPTKIKVEVSTNGTDWKTVESSLAVELAPYFTTGAIEFNGSYSYIRISNADENASMSLSEAYIFPHENDGVLHTVIEYLAEIAAFDNEIHTKASAQVYADIIEDYNANYPAAKLLSGIPYPGNKYRIHADIYSGGEHGKLQLSAFGNNTVLGGDYFTDGISAETRKAYEWYSEKLPDGSLAFRNVATGRYLSLGMTTSEVPVGWNINTSLTQRTGVPLRNAGYPSEDANYYLAVRNNAGGFVKGVKVVQNQTVIPLYSDNGTPNDTSDDINESYGVSTDFVFLPVDVLENEKKITIKANELVMRNTELKYNGKVYSMPFSQMFIKEGENEPVLPELELQCPVIHPFVGVKVNGVLKENVASLETKTVAEVEKTFLKFNWDNIENGDVLELVFEIKTPFEITPTATETTKEPKPKLYFIRNKRPYGLQPQQARPNRAADAADANIGIEGDGPISVVGDKFDYAKFDSRGTEMHLVLDKKDNPTSLDATSLFFFTQTESNDPARYYSVNVNNATTVMKFSTTGVWDEEGGTWYVQPDKAGAYSGYSIGATKLNATNNPSDAWCDVKGADVISFSTPDDDGTAWEFVPVSDDVAKVMLKTFIDKVAAELSAKFDKIKPEIAAERGYDMEKVECYKYMVNEIVDRVGDANTTNGYYAKGDIFKLVQYAQNIHMIEHEVVYALYELPQLSDETMMDDEAGFANPKWYYVRNVVSGDYAAYTSYDRAMNLEQNPTGTYPNGGMLLKNMFYFAGIKSEFDIDADKAQKPMPGYINNPGNNLILDEYLKVHVHNFMSKQLTLVSKNLTLLELENMYPGHGIQKITDIENDSKKDTLRNNENWSIDAVYELDGSSFNAYGSCLLSSQADALNDAFPNAFQVYFKDNRTVAIRAGNRNWDLVVFNHTQEFFSTVRVVVSYAYGTLTIEVYNSAGDVRVWSEKMELNNITALYSALPYDEETNSGIKVNSLVVKKTEKMNWKEHLDDGKSDLWYILPSSNLNNVDPAASNPRFAITLDGPNETNIGWTNASGIIDTDLGNQNNSSWKFERVIQFDNHIDELLAMYNLDDCVIYNKELAALMKLIAYNTALIKANTKGGDAEEALFNEVYYAILNYNGPMPDELRAPKPGSLYTIRPLVEENSENALLVHVDATDGSYVTKEVYLDDVVRDDNSYDSRAAWVFEGTAGTDGFLPLTGLQVKNIHTQCSFSVLGADESLVNESDAASVELAKLGACTTMFKVGNVYMNTTASAGQVNYEMGSGFWGSAVTEYPAEISNLTKDFSAGNVHKKSWTVETTGDVSITLKHINGGHHKLNILGATLVDQNGKIVACEYEHRTAGGNPTTQTYRLTSVLQGVGSVLPGTYTLNCYVWNFTGTGDDDDKVDEAKGVITFAGISQFAGGAAKIKNNGTKQTRWIVEEIMNPEKSVYYTTTVEEGYSTLMLGFDAVIPDGIEAHSGSVDGIVVDKKYLSMYQYESNILPANTPVVLHNSEEGETVDAKFYYSKIAGEQQPDSYMRGSLYHRVVSTDAIEAEEAYRPALINIYMLQSGKSGPKMYWIYEEYDADGDLVDENGNKDPNGGSNDAGKHVLCKANKAYIVIKSGEANNRSSFSFSLNKGGNATEIDEVEDEKCEVETIYDLQGRKLTEICHPGVYIINGKKVLVK